MDVQKLEGMQRTFRIRVGGFRIFFHADKKSRSIYITNIEKRESAYEF
jgi:mRNA-degrading endonuclease RelE of RelBE toxin-antitoxin system